jgi:hypothetical protein
MRGVIVAIGVWLLACTSALAADLPDRARLREALNTPAQAVDVAEPHMSTPDRDTKVQYLGWPARAVLDHLFGPSWRAAGLDVAFRALDGYVSHIPSERFEAYRAYLVYARQDGRAFTVDNLAQNEKDVPLGPYYLVWDNVRSPELRPLGASYWPYQVYEITLSDAGLAALLPERMADDYAEEAASTRTYCLSCHKINGYGGDKWPIDLAEQTKTLTAAAFEEWVLTPDAVKPGTTMPPLADALPESDRKVLAERIFSYLNALPKRPQ